MSRYAQFGDEANCSRCGLRVNFEFWAGEPCWVAVRKTKRAPQRHVCPAGGLHRTAEHRADGSPADDALPTPSERVEALVQVWQREEDRVRRTLSRQWAPDSDYVISELRAALDGKPGDWEGPR